MEQVIEELGDVGNCLKANEVNDVETFLLLNQSMVMTVLGLKLGSWLKIEQMQKSLRDGIDNTPAQTPSTSPLNAERSVEDNMSKDAIIKILNSNENCQTLVHGKLAEGALLKRSEKCLICRTVCRHFFASMILYRRLVTVTMKKKLAQCIVEAYDCLKVEGNKKPVESEFFWEHNGQRSGEHTGFIHNWVRNEQDKGSGRRKRRATLELTEDVTQAIEDLSASDDYQNISDLMVTTFTYREQLRHQKITPSDLCLQFPHLLWHGTIMIDDEFDRMYPNRNAHGTLSSISAFTMMLDHTYKEIACPTIQALMKVMSELKSQGNMRKAEPSGLPPLEEYAAVFVRWLQPEKEDVDQFIEDNPGEPPYILCSTMAFAEEKYYVIILRTAFDCGFVFDKAFDVLIKSYKVLNFNVPGKAKKVVELFNLIYDINTSSRLNCVNNLFERIQSAMHV